MGKIYGLILIFFIAGCAVIYHTGDTSEDVPQEYAWGRFKWTQIEPSDSTGSFAFAGTNKTGQWNDSVRWHATTGHITIADDTIVTGAGAKGRANEISLGTSSYSYGRWNLSSQIRIPTGTTAQRLTAETGDFRYNTTDGKPEIYNGSAWVSLGNGIYSGNGSLLGNTTVTGSTYTLAVTGTSTSQQFSVTAASSGTAIYGTSSSGAGIQGVSTSGTSGYFISGSGLGVQAQSTSNDAAYFIVNPSTTSAYVDVMTLQANSSATPANGFGASVDFIVETTTSSAPAGYIGMQWTDATHASRTSRFDVATVNNAGAEGIALSVRGDKSVEINGDIIYLGTSAGPQIVTGTGSPESAITAPIGSIYMRDDGGIDTTLYIKEAGAGNTGWTAISGTDGGAASGTTDGSGDITVTHSLGTATIYVTATATGTTFYTVTIHTKTSANFKIRFFDAAGSAVTSTAVTADWIAKK